ncbi:MAG: uracil-DNA glycosylase [Desulfobacterales bacterium]
MPISCHKCIHYYVTWDRNFPHGCRGMGFKGRCYPLYTVRQIMNGQDCLLFVAKSTSKKRSIKKGRH